MGHVVAARGVFDRPMISDREGWRREWLDNAPRDEEGVAWWVYQEGPTGRWLAYGLKQGQVDRSEPLSAKNFRNAVLEMYKKIGVNRESYEAEWRRRRADDQEKRQKELRRRREVREKCGLGPPQNRKLSEKIPFACHSVACPICGATVGESCRTGGRKRYFHKWVRSLEELQFQNLRVLREQAGRRRLTGLYLTVEVSHRERREIHPLALLVQPSRVVGPAGPLPASVGISSIMSLDEDY